MDKIEQFQIRQNQPFCWQSKEVRRFIRRNFSRTEARDMLDVYTGLTELASDLGNATNTGIWDQNEIAGVCSLSRPTVSKALKLLVKHKIVIEQKNKNELGYRRASTLWLPSHGDTPENPMSNSLHRDSEPMSNSLHRDSQTATGSGGQPDEHKPMSKSLHRDFLQHIESLDLKDNKSLSTVATAPRERDASPKTEYPAGFPVAFKERWHQEPKHKKFGEYSISSKDKRELKEFVKQWENVSEELRPWAIEAYMRDSYEGWVNQLHPFWGFAKNLMRFVLAGEKLRTSIAQRSQPSKAQEPEPEREMTDEEISEYKNRRLTLGLDH